MALTSNITSNKELKDTMGETLQFLAVVINPRYGILDAFGFNSMLERDFYKIVDKFYNYQILEQIDFESE